MQRRLLIDGIREIHRAMGHSVPIVELYVCPELATSAEAQELIQQCRMRQLPLFQLPRSLWSRLAFGARKDGIVAVAAMPTATCDKMHLGDNPLVVILERVEKPGNIGAVIRTADAVGARCVILADGNADLFNPNTIRASVGTIFSVPILLMTSRQAMDWVVGHGLRVLVARVDSATSCFELDFHGPVAVVLGSEAEGVSMAWRHDPMLSFCVPMQGEGDSLNVSVTAAVVLYEAWRQRALPL